MIVLNKKGPPEYQVGKIVIWLYRDLNNSEYTIREKKNKKIMSKGGRN